MRKLFPDILQDFNFEFLEFGKVDIFEKCRYFLTNNSHFYRFWGPPELCEGWWPASGGSAPSEKTRPGFLEHASCWFLMILLKIGRPLPRNVSNSDNYLQKTAFVCLPAVPPDPPDPPEVVSASAAQTPLTHAPGVRMTGVRQTPSN